MENRFGAPASGTPEGSARREFELLLLLGGSRMMSHLTSFVTMPLPLSDLSLSIRSRISFCCM